ncbi:acid protease [Nemania sp. FL0031]|nr:acid protease [Nemania sp. FL0031]
MYPKIPFLFLTVIPSLSVCIPSPPHRRGSSNLVPIVVKTSPEGNFFDAKVTLGDFVFDLLVDTGSSDLWVARAGFQCYDRANNTQLAPQELCNYEALAKYDPSVSSTFSKVENQTFGAHYGAGIALGVVGTEEAQLGGIIVRGQTIGVADRISIPSDGLYSGILGLGYPVLTSAHPGDSVANDTISLLTNKIPYEPLLFHMHDQGLVPAWFSLALARLPRGQTLGNGGFLGLGTLPGVETNGPFVTVPVELTEGIPVELTGGKISEWTLSVEGVVWGPGNSSITSKTNTATFQAVVDCGNFFNQLPQKVADQVNAAFMPPAPYDAATDSYIVDCDAIPPSFGLKIAGTVFSQRPDDLIFQLPNGTCVSTIKRSATGESIALNFIGGAWLQNVVSVFDFGKNEMRFAPRADGGAMFNASMSGTRNGTGSPPVVSSAEQLKSFWHLGSGGVMLLAWGAGVLIL